jgi:hypothetical protein
MPTFGSAVFVLIARQLLAQLDVPTRQAYTMVVVEPDERAAAAGVLGVVRNAASSLAPLFTGAAMAVPSVGGPFLVAGTLKLVYDGAVFFIFRRVKLREESSVTH